MQAWRFIFSGLLMVGSILAQTPPASPLTKDQIEAIKAKNAAVEKLNGLIPSMVIEFAMKDGTVGAGDTLAGFQVVPALVEMNKPENSPPSEDPTIA